MGFYNKYIPQNKEQTCLIGATTESLFMEMNRQKKLRKLKKYLKARHHLTTFFPNQIGRTHPTRGRVTKVRATQKPKWFYWWETYNFPDGKMMIDGIIGALRTGN